MLSEPRRLTDGAIVDDRDAGRGDALADLAGEGRRALAVEIAFEAMADSFVQQHAGPAGPSSTVISPAGASTERRLTSACFSASSIARCQVASLEQRLS